VVCIAEGELEDVVEDVMEEVEDPDVEVRDCDEEEGVDGVADDDDEGKPDCGKKGS
jgi:hypothetical protein